MFRALLELSRISNLPTVWTNVIAAWVIANRGWAWEGKLGWSLVGASLVYSAGMILNDVFDVAWDREHRPERPIPSGRMSFKVALGIGTAWLLGGATMMILLGEAKLSYTLALVIAILAYDLYHKQWVGSILVMGACRTLLYCVVASAVLPQWLKWSSEESVLPSGVLLGLYVVALTSGARAEAKGSLDLRSRIGLTFLLMLPVIIRIPMGLVEGAAFRNPLFIAPAFIVPVAYALHLLRQGGPAIGEAVGWMLAAIPAVDALAIAHWSMPLALTFVAIVPLLRLWQRVIAAT